MHSKIFKDLFPLESISDLDKLKEENVECLICLIEKFINDITRYNKKTDKQIVISRKDCLKTIYKIKHKLYENINDKDFQIINLTLYRNKYCKIILLFIKPNFSNYYFRKI